MGQKRLVTPNLTAKNCTYAAFNGTRGHPPQLQDPVPHIAIFGQMGRSRGPAAGCHHLIKRSPLNKLRVKFPAKLAWPAGARVKAFRHRCINMFHEAFSWEARTACGKMVRKGKVIVGQQRLP